MEDTRIKIKLCKEVNKLRYTEITFGVFKVIKCYNIQKRNKDVSSKVITLEINFKL